jgi:hypothetical protein
LAYSDDEIFESIQGFLNTAIAYLEISQKLEQSFCGSGCSPAELVTASMLCREAVPGYLILRGFAIIEKNVSGYLSRIEPTVNFQRFEIQTKVNRLKLSNKTRDNFVHIRQCRNRMLHDNYSHFEDRVDTLTLMLFESLPSLSECMTGRRPTIPEFHPTPVKKPE